MAVVSCSLSMALSLRETGLSRSERQASRPERERLSRPERERLSRPERERLSHPERQPFLTQRDSPLSPRETALSPPERQSSLTQRETARSHPERQSSLTQRETALSHPERQASERGPLTQRERPLSPRETGFSHPEKETESCLSRRPLACLTLRGPMWKHAFVWISNYFICIAV